jgi:hypothetical protein
MPSQEVCVGVGVGVGVVGGSDLYATVQSVVTLAYAMLVFERPIGPDTNLDLMENAVWLIIITMTTVGYGDIYPQTPMGRQVAVIAALLAGTPPRPARLLFLVLFLFLFHFLSSPSSSVCRVAGQSEQVSDSEREMWRERERVGNRCLHEACGKRHATHSHHSCVLFCLSVCLYLCVSLCMWCGGWTQSCWWRWLSGL